MCRIDRERPNSSFQEVLNVYARTVHEQRGLSPGVLRAVRHPQRHALRQERHRGGANPRFPGPTLQRHPAGEVVQPAPPHPLPGGREDQQGQRRGRLPERHRLRCQGGGGDDPGRMA